MTERTADSETKRTSASNGSGSPSGGTGGSRRLSSYLQSVAQISGVVTIIAATVYALGLFTLVLPISNSYNSTFSAAWYAVSVVPKTVVVGHGIKSLAWPSLALTLATTLFALMVLWVLYIMWVGWRHAKLTASQPALNLTFLTIITSLMIIYSLIGALIATVWLHGPTDGAGLLASNAFFGRELFHMLFPVAVLILLLYSISTVLVVARGVRYMRRPIGSRVFPSMSFRGFIFKGLAFLWLSFAFMTSLHILNIHLPTDIFDPIFLSDQGPFIIVLVTLFFLFFLFVSIAMLLLISSGARHIKKLTKEATRNKALPSPSALFASLGGSGGQRIRTFAPTLLYYAVVLFLIFYIAASGAINVLRYFVFPLIGEAREGVKSGSWLDECFIPLVVLGALVSWVIMYRKGWKGLGRGEYNLFSQSGWLSFSRDVLKGMSSRSLRSGLFWSLGVAYVFALASAFLLAHLNTPPLPKVEVNEIPQPASSQPGPEPAFQGKTLALLAHTEGYWYLIDGKENHLLVVPDQTDKFIRLKLDEQP